MGSVDGADSASSDAHTCADSDPIGIWGHEAHLRDDRYCVSHLSRDEVLQRLAADALAHLVTLDDDLRRP